MQRLMQDNVLVPAVSARETMKVPLPLRVVTRVPAAQRAFARLLGMGVRPERVLSPLA
jgi:hypothetical protein